MSRRIIVRGPGLRGPAGKDGLPGVNAIPADEAVAAYVSDEGSATYEALQNAGLGNADILLSDTRPVSPTVGLVRIGLPVEPDPEPGTVILGDNFNRADAGELGAPQVGTAPTEVNVWIRDNAAAFPTGSSSATWAIGPTDYTFEFKILNPVTGTVSIISNVAWRYTDDNNRFTLGQDGTVAKRVGGAYTSLGMIDGGAFVIGDVFRIKAAGNVHTIYRNDVQVHTFTTADLPDGDVNIFGGGGNAPRVDYIEVTTP